jgi:hyperosmotically inducible protein
MKRLFCLTILTFMLVSCATVTGRTAGELIDDQTIANEIHIKILQDPDAHYFKVSIETFRGNVSLTGTVPEKAVEERLIDSIKNIRGVKSVMSNIVVDEKSR